MKLDSNQVSTLVQLGFSPNQAKVYLALVMLGTASAKSVCKFSGVSREEVYRKLRELQELEAVERIMTKPASFKAVPMECVFANLLRFKALEISDLQTKTDELRSNLEKFEEGKKMQIEKHDITLIPEQRPILIRAQNELEKLKFRLDTICSWEKGLGWMSKHYNYFMNALNRNVEIRFIIQKAEEVKFPRYVKRLQKNSNFQIKSIYTLPPACLGLYDQKILLLDTSADTNFVGSPVLWSNNPSIVGMAEIYFETIWGEFSGKAIKRGMKKEK